MTKSLIPACENTYTSSSTNITRRTRPPRCSGWKTSFASFCTSGPWMMIHTQNTVNTKSNVQFWSVLPRYWGGVLPCFYVCVCICMYKDVYACVYMDVYAYVCIWMCINVCIWCICMYVSECICSMHVFIYMYISACICVCIYVCISVCRCM